MLYEIQKNDMKNITKGFPFFDIRLKLRKNNLDSILREQHDKCPTKLREMSAINHVIVVQKSNVSKKLSVYANIHDKRAL